MPSQEQGRTVPLELCPCISVKDPDTAFSFIMLLLILHTEMFQLCFLKFDIKDKH